MNSECPVCQTVNSEDSKYCKECTAPLRPEEEIPSTETETLRTPVRALNIGEIISGRYKLLEELGQGGMGVVYKAEQLRPLKRTVALKVIKLGMDTRQVVARFESERQALAVMDHPHIAKVFDAGITETGRPYFVMEFVPGISITEYCDRHNLTTQQRLELYIPICQAVQHAHQKGVIHRDLKPSNVLVSIQEDRPVPKIIDFGIAKATAHRLTERTLFTEQGQLIGTPEYMSPEQAEMSGLDVDTRTDIYSLGVMLYELLVGVLPFDPETLREAGFQEIQRIIRETDPPKASTRLGKLGDTQASIAEHRRTDPATLQRQLRGDLDWILMKAMEKDRTRRYETANGLAMELQRHFRSEPVHARPPSTAYRMTKFVRRHRVGVFATVLVAAAILLGLTLATIGMIQASRERDRANQEAETAQQTADFLTGLFEVSDPSEARGNTITAREILDKGAENIEKELKDQPEIQSTFMTTMGRVYQSLGLFEQATPLFANALSIRKELFGDEHLDVCESMYYVARLLSEKADYDTAERLLRDALEMHRKLEGDLELHKNLLNALAGVLWRKGDFEGAEPLFREALTVAREFHGDDHRETAGVVNNLAVLLLYKGDFDAAEPMFRESLEALRKLHGNDHPEVAVCLINLGLVMHEKGRLTEAEELYREALAAHRRLYPEGHPHLAFNLDNLAQILLAKGDNEAAEAMFWEALTMRRKLLGDKHPDVSTTMNNLAHVLEAKGDYESAETLYRDSLAMLREIIGDEHPSIAARLHNLAALLARRQEYAEAESMYREAMAMLRKLSGENHPHVANCLHSLAGMFFDQGRFEDAEAPFRESLEIRKKALPGDHPNTLRSMRDLGRCLTKLERFEEAEAELTECYRILESQEAKDAKATAKTLDFLIELYEVWGKPDKAAVYEAKRQELDK